MATAEKLGNAPAHVPIFAERHYAVPEIAAMWNLSVKTVREIFTSEPGVLVIGDDSTKGRMSRRRYRTFRIPQHVLERVHARLSQRP